VADRTVNVTINYKVNTAEVQKAQAASAAAQKATDELRKSTEAYGKAATTAHKGATAATKESEQSILGLYNAVKLVVTAGIVKEVAEMSINMARLQGNVEGVSRAFERLPGARKLLEDLRKSTHGTLTDLQLMQQAIRAQNFNIPLTNLGKYLEFAAIRAQQTGESIDYMVNSIVTGLGRDSIKILDNLQVDIAEMKRRMDEAGLSMDEAFSEQVNIQMQKAGGYIETAATEADKLAVAWDKFKTGTSQSAFWNAFLANLTAAAEVAERMRRALGGQSFSEQIQESQQQQIAQASANEFMQRRLGASRQENIEILKEEIEQLTHQLGLFAQQRDAAKNLILFYHEQIRTGKGSALIMQQSIDLQEKFIKSKKEDAVIDQEILKILQEKVRALNAEAKAEIDAKIAADAKRAAERAEELRQRRSSSGGLLKQTVDLDLKNPVTGEITKYDKDNIIKAFENMVSFSKGQIPPIVQPVNFSITPMTDGEKIGEQWEEEWRGILSRGIESSNNFLMAQEEAEIESLRRRLDNIRMFYDNEAALAGDNQVAKDRIRKREEREVLKTQRQIALKEWEAKRMSIILSTAGGIARAFIDYQWPYSLIPAAAVAAEGAVQLAAAERAKPRFAKGVIDLQGPGTGTSDSIDAKLSKGESVITAEATRKSMGLLKAIQANKIDDRILKQIDFAGGRTVQASLNDDRIVGKLDTMIKNQYQLERQGSLLYQVFTDSEGNKKRIRSKAI
jgi:hypothetical protein